MKDTDYAPRAAYFDTALGDENLIVAEVGVSAGAHAHALLKYCPIKKLYLIDPWEEANGYTYGFCSGRLLSHGYARRIEFITKTSVKAAKSLPDDFFDGVYIDQEHKYDSVKEDLFNWWPKLKVGGILGYRNYTLGNPPVKDAVDDFIEETGIKNKVMPGEIILYKEWA